MASVSAVTPLCSGLSCTKPAAKTCSSCKAIWYCSQACQASHWPSHKTLCGKRVTVIAADSKLTSQSKPCGLADHFAQEQSRWNGNPVAKERITAVFEAEAADLRTLGKSALSYATQIRRCKELMPDFSLEDGDQVVDLGTQSRAHTKIIFDQLGSSAFKVRVVDNCQGFKNSMTSLQEQYGDRLVVTEGDIESLNLPPESVKLLIAMRCLQFCRPSVDLFKSLFNALKPGGYAWITLLDGNKFTPKKELLYWYVPKGDLRQLTTNFFNDLGFSIQTNESIEKTPLQLLILQKPN